MKFAVLLIFLSSCAATLEQRCWYKARQQAQDAAYDKSAKWCKKGDDDIERCSTPDADDFFQQCMERGGRNLKRR